MTSRVIRISDTTYEALKKHAQPLEDTPDSVIQRLLQKQGTLPKPSPGTTAVVNARSRGPNRSTKRLRTAVRDGKLVVEFEGENAKTWPLPASQRDRDKIRAVRDAACVYARSIGASEGQLRAIQKQLSEAGYHLR